MFGKCRVGSLSYFVTDIEKTESFYRNSLGLAVERMDDDGQGNPWLMANTANDVTLVFFTYQRPSHGNSPVVVFELLEGGIDDIISSLGKQGVTIVTPVSQAPDGWTAEVADPDGHTISMYQAADVPRSLDTSTN